MTGVKPRMSMYVDNEAAIANMRAKTTSWRGRRFSVHASWIRDMIFMRGIELLHRRGVDLTAYALTKVLQKHLLKQARTRVFLQEPEERERERELTLLHEVAGPKDRPRRSIKVTPKFMLWVGSPLPCWCVGGPFVPASLLPCLSLSRGCAVSLGWFRDLVFA